MPLLKQKITEELESMCQETSSDFSALSFAPKHEPKMRWRYAFGNRNERYKQMILKPGVGPGGLALRTGKPATWSDQVPLRQELPMGCPLMTAEQLHAATAMPIMRGDQIYGVLLIARRTSVGYGETELNVMNRHVHAIQSLLEGIA